MIVIAFAGRRLSNARKRNDHTFVYILAIERGKSVPPTKRNTCRLIIRREAGERDPPTKRKCSSGKKPGRENLNKKESSSGDQRSRGERTTNKKKRLISPLMRHPGREAGERETHQQKGKAHLAVRHPLSLSLSLLIGGTTSEEHEAAQDGTCLAHVGPKAGHSIM